MSAPSFSFLCDPGPIMVLAYPHLQKVQNMLNMQNVQKVQNRSKQSTPGSVASLAMSLIEPDMCYL